MTSARSRRAQLIEWMRATAREAAWAPVGLIIFYLVARSIRLYDLVPALDIPSHILGGIIVTYFYRSAIRNSQQLVGTIPGSIQILLGITAAGTTVVLWEFYEYAFDYLFDTRMIRGLEDTILDMFLGLLGALGFTALYRRP